MRDLGIDLVRGISILWIVGVWHLLDYTSYSVSDSMLCANITKSVLFGFMFLSGYFIKNNVIHSFAELKEFYIKRLKRFYLLFLVACTLLFISGFLNLGGAWFSSSRQFIYTITGVSALTTIPMAPTFWFMSMLMLFYLITPIITIHKRYFLRIIICILIILLTYLYSYYFEISKSLLIYLIAFLLGITTNNKIISCIKSYSYIIFVISLCGWILLSFFSLSFCNLLRCILWIPLMISMCEILLAFDKYYLLTRVAKMTSYIALALYLFHRHVFLAIKYLFSDINICVAYFIMLPIAIIVAYCIQKGYDYFLARYANRSTSKNSVIVDK